MADFLVPIYEDAYTISRLRHAVEKIRVFDYLHALHILKEVFPKLLNIAQNYAKINAEEGFILWNRLYQANQPDMDTIYLADTIESQILPMLTKYMSTWGHIEEADENKFKLESTMSGFLTIQDIERNMYFHSTVDPMEEARKIAEYIYIPSRKEFAVLGCGLGYLPYQLYKLSRGSTMIYVYESNEKILEYAYQFGVLSWIPKECITVVKDQDILLFLNKANDVKNAGFYMFYPELEMLSGESKDIMMNLYLQYNTDRIFVVEEAINFWRNSESGCHPISEFDKSKVSEEVIVVAAGPSLDDTLDFLRENKGKKTIIAVGTVFKKLLNLGIEPDFVTVLDPQERTYKQIEGVEDKRVPMILSIGAYWEFARKYQGEKFLVYSGGVELARVYASEHNEELWVCGSTVTAFATQVAIWCGAKKIYFVGVDLAYQEDGISHASGTMDCTKRDILAMTPIEGVGGITVYADSAFLTYRQWIEDRIKATPEIEYVNMSKTGARIAGTKEVV